jgi:putative transposase
MLRSTAGWIVNDKRVERICGARAEGPRQTIQARSHLACGRILHPSARHAAQPCLAYDFVEDHTHERRQYRNAHPSWMSSRMKSVHPGRPEAQVIDMIDVLSDQFVLRGIPEHIRSDNGPEFVAKGVQDWIGATGARRRTLSGTVLGRTASSRASTLGFRTNCLMERSSARLPRQDRNRGLAAPPQHERPHGSLGYKPPTPEVFIPASPRGRLPNPDPAPPALAESPNHEKTFADQSLGADRVGLAKTISYFDGLLSEKGTDGVVIRAPRSKHWQSRGI